jgi:hypothetical protein
MVQDPHKHPKDVITTDALAPTLPHTPDPQRHCFERFVLF